MTDVWALAVPAFALGFALGAAPGPVQVLILSQTAQRGFGGGLRVMLGANLTLYAILLALALGLSAVTPPDWALRALRASGGAVLIWIAIVELRTIWRASPAAAPDGRFRSLGPTAMGIVMVLLNPGAWIFFATTASTVLAGAADEGGRTAAVLAATAMALGVSVSDFTFTLLGSGGHAFFGERGLRWIRSVLAGLLGGIGIVFLAQGVLG